MRKVLMVLVLLPQISAAHEWLPMTGTEITAVLTDRVVTYDSATQRFYASGRTSYDTGSESWGYWEVRGDMYCSQWPPADGWACYGLERFDHDNMVRFIGESGHHTDGVLGER